jgi:hypothetical protein
MTQPEGRPSSREPAFFFFGKSGGRSDDFALLFLQGIVIIEKELRGGLNVVFVREALWSKS